MKIRIKKPCIPAQVKSSPEVAAIAQGLRLFGPEASAGQKTQVFSYEKFDSK